MAQFIIIFAWFIARHQSHTIYILRLKEKVKVKKLNNRETNENMHSNSTRVKFLNKMKLKNVIDFLFSIDKVVYQTWAKFLLNKIEKGHLTTEYTVIVQEAFKHINGQ